MKKTKPENKKRTTPTKESEWRRVRTERDRRENRNEEVKKGWKEYEGGEREAEKRKWQGMWKEKRIL
ncbi:MAG: hypothetical protein SO314_05830 [Alphaproteobacteria bacterium]|nr:hypothetical protein [Alphaproteobacteria bacterium]